MISSKTVEGEPHDDSSERWEKMESAICCIEGIATERFQAEAFEAWRSLRTEYDRLKEAFERIWEAQFEGWVEDERQPFAEWLEAALQPPIDHSTEIAEPTEET